ncbi:GNAT family N-acetyltransferase [Dysosmobacter acutus]|uniref:GNAT family N-acetyltransferase n=1 Tax=Dysosmobacter acutus TaxID=2841504 RepID=UPI001F4CEFB9|nr:GNAT family N-acetyltransferase [Dysosmobacter acutus]
MIFKKVTNSDGAKLRRYYRNCSYGLCEYSVGTKMMWRDELHPMYAEEAGCLIVKNLHQGQTVFDYPVPGPEGDEDAALTAIETWCLEQGIAPVISVVPDCKAAGLMTRYPYVKISNLRTWRDYLYDADALGTFAGRKYSGQRNHINKFRAACPDAVFRVLTHDDSALIDGFWADYDAVFTKDDKKAKSELRYAKRTMALAGKPWFCAGGMELNGRLISLALGERCGDTLIVHIEKALYGYEGVYPATVQAFAQAFSDGARYSERARYINREDDAADRGLRTSKLQYLPVKLAPKYCFEPANELIHVPQIPELRTQRLTLSAITQEDAEPYYKLCMDRDRNRWWGYDDPAGVEGELCEDSFLRIAQADFEKRRAVNFAVRLEGKMIGEAILYRFDYRGGAELGCRIAPEYAGHGYGTEAFTAVAEWGLYKVHLARIVAKCFHENEASRKMLASCMRPNGQDDTFYYFQKVV